MKQFDAKNEIRMTNRAIACVSKENSRYAIAGPLVVAAAGKGERAAYAVSTDGKCLAVVPGVATGTGSGGAVIVPASAFPKRAGKSAKDCVLTIAGEGAGGVTRIHSVEPGTPTKPGKPITMPAGVPQEEGTFPPFADVVPGAGSFATIALNPTLLANVAAAVGQGEHFEKAPAVILYVPIGKGRYRVRGGAGQDVTVHEPSARPMIITSTQTTGAAIGLQMPIKADDMPASLASGFQSVARAAALVKDPASTEHAEPLEPVDIIGDEPTGPGAGDFEELRAELATARAEIERLSGAASGGMDELRAELANMTGRMDAERMRAQLAEDELEHARRARADCPDDSSDLAEMAELVKALRADTEYAEKRIAELSDECERLRLELEAAQGAAEELERNAGEHAEKLSDRIAELEPAAEKLERIEADQAEAERDADIAKARAIMKASRVAVVDTVPASGWTARAGVTKKGREWVALCPTDRLDDADYAELLDRVKGIGGWWCRAWDGEPGGFAVWPEKREALAELIGA
jgi:hypothetical protein